MKVKYICKNVYERKFRVVVISTISSDFNFYYVIKPYFHDKC